MPRRYLLAARYMPARIVSIVTSTIAALILMWPALYNGQPFFYSDTTAYIRGATAGIERLTGITTAWSVSPTFHDALAPVPVAPLLPTTRSGMSPQDEMPSSIIAGRSVYYGALLYAGHVARGFWITVFVQSIILVAAIMILLRSYNLLSMPTLALTLLVLCCTPAALYVSFLMPDIFAGLTILCSAMLTFGPAPGRKASTAFWFVTLTYALLCHTVNILLCLSIWAMALALIPVARPRPALLGMLLLPAALLIALAGESAFTAGVRHFLGQAPIRPPFLMARIIGDGTGERYLRTHCDHGGLTVCRFVDRLPMSFDTFLWSGDPDRGVFSVADPATKRDLEREQLRFVYAVVADDPWQQLTVSMGNFYNQLISFKANEFTMWEGAKDSWPVKLPSDTWRTMQRSRYFLGNMPVRTLTVLGQITTCAGTLYLLVGLWCARKRSTTGISNFTQPALVVLFGILANAAISGCLAEPLNRFGARVIWLVPTAALVLDFDLRRGWWQAAVRRLLMSPHLK